MKELRSDLRNAEDCETAATENFSSGNHEDLSKQLIIQNMKQKELERKFDQLQGAMVKQTEEMRNSEAMKHLIETVETSIGKLELFGQDFESIHSKIQEIDGMLEKKLGVFQPGTAAIKLSEFNHQDIEDGFAAKFGELTKRLQSSATTERKREEDRNEKDGKRANYGEIIKQLDKEMKVKMEELSKVLLKIEDKTSIVKQKVKHIQEVEYKCWKCKSILNENLLLRVDGFSVECDCRDVNIVGQLKEGNIWMAGKCHDIWHIQQYPESREQGLMGECQVCGLKGKIWDMNHVMALRC